MHPAPGLATPNAAGAPGDDTGKAAATGYGAVTGASVNAALNPMEPTSGAADMGGRGVTGVGDTANAVADMAAGIAAAMDLNPHCRGKSIATVHLTLSRPATVPIGPYVLGI